MNKVIKSQQEAPQRSRSIARFRESRSRSRSGSTNMEKNKEKRKRSYSPNKEASLSNQDKIEERIDISNKHRHPFDLSSAEEEKDPEATDNNECMKKLEKFYNTGDKLGQKLMRDL
ncbi:hypothetical protein PoB_005784400 [Plakobranchus ocellatus]|uniref:Uncharacterized protein n=1 Tax=Plakobranchus ocellatus TaxID=259542 RepID=A0AAV4CFB3_9GAST|nr:hypothetical protein PoB_005784400 [Plakobranchus ocellatus]